MVATEEGFERWETELPNPVDYEAFIAGKPTRYEWPELDENAPLGLCYTSGTTGNPKGVEYEHRSQYLHTMAQCDDRLHGPLGHRHAVRDRADVPRARLGPAVVGDHARHEAGDAEPLHGSGDARRR